jgi:hypothetical protein
LFPLLGALIGLLSVLITYYFLVNRLKKGKFELIKRLEVRLSNLQQKDSFENLLDEKLDVFIADLRRQIPMGTMLLTSSLSGKVKSLAKEGILKMLPDVTERVKVLVLEDLDFKEELYHFFRKELITIPIYASLLGLLIATLAVVFI